MPAATRNEVKSVCRVHKIASDGRNSVNLIEFPERLVITVYQNNQLLNESISFRAANGKFNIYRTRKGKPICYTRKGNFISGDIQKYIGSCFNYNSNHNVETPSRYIPKPFWVKRKGMIQSKLRRVAKIIQGWACPKLNLKVVNCKKYSLGEVLNYLTIPASLGYKDVLWYSPAFKKSNGARTIPEVLDRCIGKRRPKKLNKIIYSAFEAEQSDIKDDAVFIYNKPKVSDIIFSYKFHKNLLDINHTYKVLGKNPHINNPDFQYGARAAEFQEKLRKLIKTIGPARYVKFCIEEPSTNWSWQFRDTLTQWGEFPDKIDITKKDLTTIEKLHNYVSREYRKLQDGDYELGQPDEILALQGSEIGDSMKLVIPTKKSELYDWGDTLSNCVASYADQIKSGYTQVFGVLKEGNLTYNIEVRDSRVTQFYGKYNHLPEQDDYRLVMNFLEKNKIVKKFTWTDGMMRANIEPVNIELELTGY